jgi:hypothetical protein
LDKEKAGRKKKCKKKGGLRLDEKGCWLFKEFSKRIFIKDQRKKRSTKEKINRKGKKRGQPHFRKLVLIQTIFKVCKY